MKIEKRIRQPSRTALCGSPEQRLSLALGVLLSARPAGAHEEDLVDQVRNVVGHVQPLLIHGSEQEAEQVAERVDAPTRCDDQAHVVECSRNCVAALLREVASFPTEDLPM